jgi:hypothetical protein
MSARMLFVQPPKRRFMEKAWPFLAIALVALGWYADRWWNERAHERELQYARSVQIVAWKRDPVYQPALRVDCDEYGRICRGRSRMEKVK